MTLPPLPEPDTHCFDDDTGLDVWSHSPDQMRAYGEACAAAERERCARVAEQQAECNGLAAGWRRASTGPRWTRPAN